MHPSISAVCALADRSQLAGFAARLVARWAWLPADQRIEAEPLLAVVLRALPLHVRRDQPAPGQLPLLEPPPYRPLDAAHRTLAEVLIRGALLELGAGPRPAGVAALAAAVLEDLGAEAA